MATSARFGNVTTRKPAFSRASLTAARNEAHTSGAPPQLNRTAAFSGIPGAPIGCGAVPASRGAACVTGRCGACVVVRCEGAFDDVAGAAPALPLPFVASTVAALVAGATFAGRAFLAACDSPVA